MTPDTELEVYIEWLMNHQTRAEKGHDIFRHNRQAIRRVASWMRRRFGYNENIPLYRGVSLDVESRDAVKLQGSIITYPTLSFSEDPHLAKRFARAERSNPYMIIHFPDITEILYSYHWEPEINRLITMSRIDGAKEEEVILENKEQEFMAEPMSKVLKYLK